MHLLLTTFAYLICGLLGIIADAAFAPNHFLGTCLDDAWVKSMKVDNQERDAHGRLVYPFLQPALKYPRHQFGDLRTQAVGVYAGACIPDGAFIYGVDAKVDADTGAVVDKGRVNGSVISELGGWNSHTLATLVFSILLQEVVGSLCVFQMRAGSVMTHDGSVLACHSQYGYEVSLYYVTDTLDLTQRMSSTGSGVCTPTHVNLEVWITGIEAALQVYANESYSVGGVGYFGRSGMYTTQDFIRDGLKYSPIFYADYWKNKYDDTLLRLLPVSRLTSNAKFFPPAEVGCANGSFGCQDYCSRTEACTRRMVQKRECIVVIMMFDYYDPGYLQSVLANNDIPAYFCFLGYAATQDYALEAQRNGEPVLFYHFEPDIFHFTHPNIFQRVFLPRSVPERVVLATGTFGENGFGSKTDSPVDVDFPTIKLSKYAASLLQNEPQLGPLLSKLSLSDLNINELLRDDSVEPDPSFCAACNWVKDNFDIWKLWLERLPLCALSDHISYKVRGCDGNITTARLVTFEWKHPDPKNASRAHDCDGGVTQLPATIVTGRSCAWILEGDWRWAEWITTKPTCDASFYKYNITGYDAASTRSVQYFWFLGGPSDPSKSTECGGGVTLPHTVLIDCECMPFSSPVFLSIAVIAGITVLIPVLAIVFVYRNRHATIIKRSQFEFLVLVLGGGLLICGAAVVYAGEPSYVLCGARPILVSTGFTTIFSTLVVNSLRVYRVFMRSFMKRVVVTTRMMFKFLAIFYFVDAILFVAWFGLAFPKPTLQSQDATNFQGLVDRISCQSSSFIFTGLLMFWKAILLCLGLYISFLIRNVSADFQESPWIFGSAMVVLIGGVVILPLAYPVDMAAAAFSISLACSFLLSTPLIMGFMLVPKLFRLLETSRGSNRTINSINMLSSKQGSVTALDANQFNAIEDGTSIQTSTQVRPRAIKYNVAPGVSRHGSV